MEFVSEYLTQSLPVVYTLITVGAALILRTIVKRALDRFSREGFYDPALGIVFHGLSRWLIIIAVVLLSLGYFGLSVASLWASLTGVIALIALGFVAVWSVLSNFLCSILLIVFSPFRIGDEIEVQEPANEFFVKGKVVSMNMMFTTLSTGGSDDEQESLIRIPNNIFFQKYTRCTPGKKTESLKGYIAREQDD
tara:strand:- start:421 stop:1002 length:582 start_codon:yes stop_codon:yes gene_type:complete